MKLPTCCKERTDAGREKVGDVSSFACGGSWGKYGAEGDGPKVLYGLALPKEIKHSRFGAAEITNR